MKIVKQQLLTVPAVNGLSTHDVEFVVEDQTENGTETYYINVHEFDGFTSYTVENKSTFDFFTRQTKEKPEGVVLFEDYDDPSDAVNSRFYKILCKAKRAMLYLIQEEIKSNEQARRKAGKKK